MQINFTAKKLEKANKYVNLLHSPQVKKVEELKKKEKNSLFLKIFKFLFK